MEDILFATKKGNVATDTRRVARALGLPHEQVLQAVGALECSPEFNRLNFVPIVDVDGQQVVVMTRAGFMRLLMDLPGATATALQEQVIAQFDRMEAQLREADTAAAAQSLADQLVQAGATQEEAKAVSEQAKGVFAGIANLGFRLARLEA